MDKLTFSLTEASRLTGASRDRIKKWAQVGLLRSLSASGDEIHKYGHYTFFEVIRMSVLARLVDAGVGLQVAHGAAQALEASLDLGLDLAWMVIVPRNGTPIINAFEKYYPVETDVDGVVYVLPVRPIIQKLVEQIEADNDQ